MPARHPDQPHRPGLALLAGDLAAQLPDHDGGGEELDDRVQPEPVSATDDASTPAVMATAASAVIQAMDAYSSQNPRRRSRAGLAAAAVMWLTRRRGTARPRFRSRPAPAQPR
jgi:hypothetical protein